MHVIVGGARERDVRLPRHTIKAVSRVAVKIILSHVRRVVDGPVAPRAPRTHQILILRPVAVVRNVCRVVKLGHVHVRAHTVRVLGAKLFSAPEALAKQRLDRLWAVPNVGGAHWVAGGRRSGRARDGRS